MLVCSRFQTGCDSCLLQDHPTRLFQADPFVSPVPGIWQLPAGGGSSGLGLCGADFEHLVLAVALKSGRPMTLLISLAWCLVNHHCFPLTADWRDS